MSARMGLQLRHGEGGRHARPVDLNRTACGGRLARWGFGVERDLVGLGGVTGRVRPRRALCPVCGVSRVLLPDSMLRRRQYGVEVIWAALLAAVRGGPWNRVAAQLGVP